MYLEISARRSGKTKRMMQAIEKELDKGFDCAVVFPKFSMAHDCLPREWKCHNSIKILSMDILNSKTFDINDYLGYCWFFDEFDMRPELPLPIFENGYYVTTPFKLRSLDHLKLWSTGRIKDELLDLLKLNKGKYEAHIWPDMSNTEVWEACAHETFETEFSGKIFTK